MRTTGSLSALHLAKTTTRSKRAHGQLLLRKACLMVLLVHTQKGVNYESVRVDLRKGRASTMQLSRNLVSDEGYASASFTVVTVLRHIHCHCLSYFLLICQSKRRHSLSCVSQDCGFSSRLVCHLMKCIALLRNAFQATKI